MSLYNVFLALRTLRKRSRFSVLCVGVLALGTAGFCTILTVAEGILLSPLPFPNADRLIVVNSQDLETQGTLPVSYPDFLDWREASSVLAEIAALAETSVTLTGTERARHLAAEVVSSGYFATLGVNSYLGRVPSRRDNQPGAEPVVALSADLWRSQFNSDEEIVGKTLELNKSAFTVIGVLPEGFKGYSGEAALWLPITSIHRIAPRFEQLNLIRNRAARWHQVLGLLHHEEDLVRARQELSSVAARLAESYPDSNVGRGIYLESAALALTQKLRAPIFLLLAGAGLVLLVACTTFSSLVLGELENRRRDFAIRLSLGAPANHLVIQPLLECGILAALGGVIGLGAGFFATRQIGSYLPFEIPGYVEITAGWGVGSISLIAVLVIGLAFSAIPLAQSLRLDLAGAMKQQKSKRRVAGGWPSLRQLVVIGEVGIASALLLASGLLFESSENLASVDLGFRPGRLLSFKADFSFVNASPEEKSVLAKEAWERLESMPTVEAATVSSYLFFSSQWLNQGIEIENQPAPDSPLRAYRQGVGPNFFTALEIPLLRGRLFNLEDHANSQKVAILSRDFADRYFAGGEVLGRRLRDATRPNQPWMTIVGVVEKIENKSLLGSTPEDPEYYYPLFQEPIHSMSFMLRSSSEPRILVENVKTELAALNREISAYNFLPMVDSIEQENAELQGTSLVFYFFCGISFFLALAGVYAVVSLATISRYKEIAIRLSVGAPRKKIFRMIVTDSWPLIFTGVALGLGLYLLGAEVIQGVVFGVEVLNWTSILQVLMLLLVISAGISAVPAKAALKIDPMRALRDD